MEQLGIDLTFSDFARTFGVDGRILNLSGNQMNGIYTLISILFNSNNLEKASRGFFTRLLSSPQLD